MTNEFITLVDEAVSYVEGSTLAQQLEADMKATLAELESISETDLKTAVSGLGVAVLGGLATGGEAGAIAAGIAAAPALFAAAGKDISNKTTATLVTSITNSLAVVAPAASTPAA